MNDTQQPQANIPNKAHQFQSKKACIDALTWLSQTFPEAFDTEHRVRPLKIGVMADILEYAEKNNVVDVSKSKLRQAVVMFTRRMEYLVCVKAREQRIALDGCVDGEVTAQEAEKAALRIKERMDKMVKEKHAQKSQKTDELQACVQEVKAVTDVTVKRKVTRRFDPEAVARLKAKLGIAANSKERA